VRGCVHGSLDDNQVGRKGGAAIAGALQYVPSLTQLVYVVGEGARCKAAGWGGGEAVMVGGVGRRFFLVSGCEVGASVL
jgi:hypothetical protein